jgi:hypothetical protein
MSRYYAIIAHDAPGAAAIRGEKLKEHLAHVEEQLDRLAVAGPLRDEAGIFTGSLMIVKADTAEAARELLQSDPYFKAGAWSDIEVRAFGAVAGDWVGGKNW